MIRHCLFCKWALMKSHCNQNLWGKICTRHSKYVLIWMTAIIGSHLSGWTICCFGWGGNEGLPQSLPYPLALQSLRKDLLFNSWLDRIFSPVCKHSDTQSTDNLPYWGKVCVCVSFGNGPSLKHTHKPGPPGVPSHLAPRLLTHCDRAIIRSDELSIRN